MNRQDGPDAPLWLRDANAAMRWHEEEEEARRVRWGGAGPENAVTRYPCGYCDAEVGQCGHWRLIDSSPHYRHWLYVGGEEEG
jgi:hypothetical protein